MGRRRSAASRPPGWPRTTPTRRSTRSGRPSVEMGVAAIGAARGGRRRRRHVLDVAVALEACARELRARPAAQRLAGASATRDSAATSGAPLALDPDLRVVLGPARRHPRAAARRRRRLVGRRRPTPSPRTAARRARPDPPLLAPRPSTCAGATRVDGLTTDVVRRAAGHLRRRRGQPASPAGAWRPRSTTPRSASSSASRSGRSRRSSTCAPRCSRPPRPSPPPPGTSPSRRRSTRRRPVGLRRRRRRW